MTYTDNCDALDLISEIWALTFDVVGGHGVASMKSVRVYGFGL